MAKETLKEQVYVAMKDILAGCPGGMRANELSNKIKDELHKKLPEESPKLNSIRAQMSDCTSEENDFFKERRKGESGVFYALAEISPTLLDETSDDETSQSSKWQEKDFYASFAKYLTYGEDNEEDGEKYINECTRAIPIGGNKLGKDKWVTPDVMGVFRPLDDDAVQFPHEIISVEIKIRGNLIQALGQACAYLLFSHKVYLVIPNPLGNPDRIEALCRILGIGLVYFDPNVGKITSSIYNAKFLAQRHMPDMNFVNSISTDVIDELYGKERRGRRFR